MLLTVILIIISIPSPPRSFRPALKPSFRANPYHRSLPFYRAMLCIRGTSHGPVSVSVCRCPSVTSRCSTKTAKRRITQTTPHDTPRDSSFLLPKISAKFDRGHAPPTGAPNAGGVGQNRRLSTNNRLYLENGTRYTHGFY